MRHILCFFGLHLPGGPMGNRFTDTRVCLRCNRIQRHTYDGMTPGREWR